MKMENRSLMPEAMVRGRSLWRRPWLWLLLLAVAAGAAYFVLKPASDAQLQRAGAGRRGVDPNRPTSVVASPDRKSTRLNSSHPQLSRMPSSA